MTEQEGKLHYNRAESPSSPPVALLFINLVCGHLSQFLFSHSRQSTVFSYCVSFTSWNHPHPPSQSVTLLAAAECFTHWELSNDNSWTNRLLQLPDSSSILAHLQNLSEVGEFPRLLRNLLHLNAKDFMNARRSSLRPLNDSSIFHFTKKRANRMIMAGSQLRKRVILLKLTTHKVVKTGAAFSIYNTTVPH